MPFMQPNASSRQRLLVLVSVLVALVVSSLVMVLSRTLSGPPRFRSSALVLMMPFTNAVLSQDFQARAFQSIPAIHLEHRGGSVVEVVAYAATSTAARTDADEATDRLISAAMGTFGSGVRLSIVKHAEPGRRSRFFDFH